MERHRAPVQSRYDRKEIVPVFDFWWMCDRVKWNTATRVFARTYLIPMQSKTHSRWWCMSTSWKQREPTNILRPCTVPYVATCMHIAEEMDVIFHSPSCLEWTLGWNTSPEVLHATQCQTAYLITVQPRGQGAEQTHGVIDVIRFHVWLSQTRPTRSDPRTCRFSWCYTDERIEE